MKTYLVTGGAGFIGRLCGRTALLSDLQLRHGRRCHRYQLLPLLRTDPL